MSLFRVPSVNQFAAASPVSPHTLAAIADEAFASGDEATAVLFVEMAYQASDDSHPDVPEASFPPTAYTEFAC